MAEKKTLSIGINFYDDYLHRGDVEEGKFDALLDTPLRHMSFYDYGMYVKVVPGDPANLLPNQYPFATLGSSRRKPQNGPLSASSARSGAHASNLPDCLP